MLFDRNMVIQALKDLATDFRSEWNRKFSTLGMAVNIKREIRKSTTASSRSVNPVYDFIHLILNNTLLDRVRIISYCFRSSGLT